MAFPLILSRFKSLLPVAVVGGSVAITIKLLTQQNTPNSQLLSVEAEEDIAKTEHKEELVEPEPEPAPKESEPEENSADAEEEEVNEENSGDGSDNQSDEQENAQQEEQEEDKKPEARSIKPSEISEVLIALLQG